MRPLSALPFEPETLRARPEQVCLLACRNSTVSTRSGGSYRNRQAAIDLQIMYQIMNIICLYSVVLSEVVAQTGDSAADYASFFSAASVFIIVVMVVYVCYFDFWSSGLLQEYVFQPVANKVKAVDGGLCIAVQHTDKPTNQFTTL